MMTSEQTGTIARRRMCVHCKRANSTCICGWVRPLSSRVEVIIVQHPLEANHVKGSAGLLQMSLHNCVLLQGELLDTAALQQIFDQSRQPVLLYPSAVRNNLDQSANLLAMPPNQLRLIVLDATWRKSRKMLHLNPLLQALPRMSIHDPAPSRYAIRKAHQPHQRSTLEATCAALLQLDEAAAPLHALLDAFDGFVAQQASFRPPN